ncbi:MAG: electron transfer flavoprotein subunit alpha/FixB family protein [Hyphomicrobiaceae bacterium]|nr:electron transfer flavoprotein subunit alpha/FixB family protein [Hyphomicrobiaceae bacterium]
MSNTPSNAPAKVPEKVLGRVLVLADHDHQSLSPFTPRMVSAAQSFDLPVDLLVAGNDCSPVANQAASFDGIEQVLLTDREELITAGAEDLCALLVPLLQDTYDVLLTPANGLGRDLVPRLAAQLDVSPLSDVTRIIEPDLFERPIHAGAALVQIRLSEAKKLMTLRAGNFPPMKLRDDKQAPAKLVSLDDKALASRKSKLIGEEFFWEQPSLETASVVIGVGGGAQDKENFALIENLMAQFDASLGGTRLALELGMVPNNELIGQTGRTIAPKLYIALGISGAVQHLAGIRDAQVIIAINKDPDAPIFKVADYGLVGDLREVLPELQKALVL